MDFIPTIFNQTNESDRRIIICSDFDALEVNITTATSEEEQTNE